MVRVCSKCGYENQDDWDFCAKCGNQLVEDIEYQQFMPIMSEKSKNHLIIISYIITILLSWGGVLIYFLNNKFALGYLGFFGAFMPFYLIQAPDKKIRMHGYIMLAISLIGIGLSFYLLFYS